MTLKQLTKSYRLFKKYISLAQTQQYKFTQLEEPGSDNRFKMLAARRKIWEGIEEMNELLAPHFGKKVMAEIK